MDGDGRTDAMFVRAQSVMVCTVSHLMSLYAHTHSPVRIQPQKQGGPSTTGVSGTCLGIVPTTWDHVVVLFTAINGHAPK